MPSKREEITKIVNKFITYGKEQNFPYFDNEVKIRKFKQDYTADHIAGLVNKYCIPAYADGYDNLKGYMNLELDRLRMLGAMSGVDETTIKFQLSTNQEDYVLSCILEIIEVIS
jgi:hypothetical protein